LKRFVFLFLSLLVLILIIGCITVLPPVSNIIPPIPQPSVIREFSSNPSAINSGGTSTLLWNVTGANSVNIDQGIGPVDIAGTRIVSPTISTVYTISATNAAGTVTRSSLTTVNSVLPPPVPIPFSVISVTANTDLSTFTGVCPKIFTFYATITANGPGTVTYRWERSNGGYSEPQSVTFYEAGIKTTTSQWELSTSSSGWHRIHVLTPNNIASNPVYYTLNCGGTLLVTGIVVGIDEYPFTGPCPKTIQFFGTIAANGPGLVTYRWDRSDGAIAPMQTITFISAGTQTVTNLWTRGEGNGWQRLHVLTPNDAISSQIDFAMTCWNLSE
jgi:hypothetical protein